MGQIIKFDDTYFTDGMIKVFGKGCNNSFKCKAQKAGGYMSQSFSRSKSWGQKNPGKMIKAILYDLDGVLVDATEWHYESLNAALKEVCGFIINRDEHISTFNGIPTMKKLEILNQQGSSLGYSSQTHPIDSAHGPLIVLH